MLRKKYSFPILMGALLVCLTGCFHQHQYVPTVIPPTCTKAGFTEYRCVCGDVYTGEPVAALEHNYSAAIDGLGELLHLCDSCGSSYRTDIPETVYQGAIKDYLIPFELYSRKRSAAPEFVMIHFSSAVVLDPEDPYNMDTVRQIFADYQVSTHYIIHRDGEVRCYIPENLVAYHAGYGTWGNDPRYTDLMNDYAIGIELVGIGSQQDMAQYLNAAEYNALDPALIGFTDAQYDALKLLVEDLCDRYAIPKNRQHIIGHQEYSPQKTDPGELFQWDKLFS